MTAADPGSETPHKNHEIYFVPGLQRGLLVLEAIASAGRPLSVSELAHRLALTRSSVFRISYTLRLMGFLEVKRDSKALALGPRVLNIGFAYLAAQDIVAIALPELEALRDATRISVHLAIRDKAEVLYLSCVQTRSGYLSNMNVGVRLPAYASPMGWLLLGDLTDSELAALFGREKFQQLTDQTPKDLVALAGRIREAVDLGHVLSRGSMQTGGSSIAAPVYDDKGRTVAAIDLSGPDLAFSIDEWETRYVAEILATARSVSRRLGFEPSRSTRPRGIP